MASPSEVRGAQCGDTVVQRPSPGEKDRGSACCRLLVLSRKGRVLATAPAEGLSVPVGRSSSCALRCQDPSFPRHAGDVIVKSTPLFRFASGSEGQAVVPLRSGRPLALHGCRLHLLERGEAMRNSPARRRRRVRGFILALACVLGAGAVGARLITASSSAPGPGMVAATAARTLDLSVKASQSSAPAPLRPLAPSPTRSLAEAPPRPVVPSPTRPVTPWSPGTVAEAPPRLLAPSPIPFSPEPPPAMDDAAFSQLLAGAEARLRSGHPRGAGALLAPVFETLSAGQAAQAVGALEPLAAGIFREAYLGLPYDRAHSVNAIKGLAECGLVMLPSCRKAGELLIERGRGLKVEVMSNGDWGLNIQD